MKLVVLFGAIASVYIFSTSVEAMPHHVKGKNPGLIKVEHLRNGRRQQQGKDGDDGGKADDELCVPSLYGKCWSISFLRRIAKVYGMQSPEHGSRRRECMKDEYGQCIPIGQQQG